MRTIRLHQWSDDICRNAITAVRQDSKIGANTCSIFDECLSDDELVGDFIAFLINNHGEKSIKPFIAQCRKLEQDRRKRDREIRNA